MQNLRSKTICTVYEQLGPLFPDTGLQFTIVVGACIVQAVRDRSTLCLFCPNGPLHLKR